MNELNRNLDLVINKISKPTIETSSSNNNNNNEQVIIGNLTQKPITNIDQAPSWSETQVDAWLKNSNIDESIVINLSPCNGQSS